MVDRIVSLREKLNMNQEDFAKKIGVSRNFISLVETTKRNLSDRTIVDICREFNVNEKWLRTGEGEMFNQSLENTVDRLCAELHASELESGIIRAYFRIDPRIREPFMQRMIQEMQSEYAALAPVSAESEQSEPVQPVEQKTPTPVSESGLDISDENFMEHLQRMNPDLKQYWFDQMRKPSKLQKEPSIASAPLAVDDKTPGSERPDQS